MSEDRLEHVVTSIEPAWVQEEHQPDADGSPVYVGGSQTVLGSDGMEDLDNEYECRCGVDLEDWDDVEEHFEHVANDELLEVYVSCTSCIHDEEVVIHEDDVVIETNCSSCGETIVAHREGGV